MSNRYIFLIIIGCLITTFFSCEEKELMVNANDVSYIILEGYDDGYYEYFFYIL